MQPTLPLVNKACCTTSQELFARFALFCGVLYLPVFTWWRHQMETFPRYWPFVRGIHRFPVNSPHKGQWRGVLMFSLICVWINGWVNNREAGDLRRYRAHYDVTVMIHICQDCFTGTGSTVRFLQCQWSNWPIWVTISYEATQCKRFPHYCPFLEESTRVIGGFAGQKPYSANICGFLYCWSEQDSQQTVGLLIVWNVMMLRWHQCDGQERIGFTLHWRHNDRVGVSNQRRLDCLLSRLFKHRPKAPKHRVDGLYEGNPPVTDQFPSQSAGNAENASNWWRHHVISFNDLRTGASHCTKEEWVNPICLDLGGVSKRLMSS